MKNWRRRGQRGARLLMYAFWMAMLCICCETAGFKRSYMALDSNGERKRDVFYTDTEAIYCVVEMASGRADVTVTAQLRATALYIPPRGNPVDVDIVLAADEEAPGAGDDITLSFEWERDGDEPYPAGSFVCEVFLDGVLEAQLPFEVRYPDCPVAPIWDGLVCEGFVLPGAKCAGAVSPDICRCESGEWRC